MVTQLTKEKRLFPKLTNGTQGTIRKKEEELTGAIWDCLPVTEKTKDEINFSGLGEEVRSAFRVSFFNLS